MRKYSFSEKAAIFPEKLNNLSGGDFVRPTIHNRLPQQGDYYETDSESDDDILDMVIICYLGSFRGLLCNLTIVVNKCWKG